MSGHADDSGIECAAHGSSQGAFVCQHLTVGSGLGFNQGFDPDDPDCRGCANRSARPATRS